MKGDLLTSYPSLVDDASKAIGGEEQHKLTEAEMPRHRHVVYPHAGVVVGPPGAHRGAGSEDPHPTSKTDGTTNEAGGSQPHNIRPPFVALYYCIKD